MFVVIRVPLVSSKCAGRSLHQSNIKLHLLPTSGCCRKHVGTTFSKETKMSGEAKQSKARQSKTKQIKQIKARQGTRWLCSASVKNKQIDHVESKETCCVFESNDSEWGSPREIPLGLPFVDITRQDSYLEQPRRAGVRVLRVTAKGPVGNQTVRGHSRKSVSFTLFPEDLC